MQFLKPIHAILLEKSCAIKNVTFENVQKILIFFMIFSKNAIKSIKISRNWKKCKTRKFVDGNQKMLASLKICLMTFSKNAYEL